MPTLEDLDETLDHNEETSRTVAVVNDDEFVEESLTERLVGLTEMFPEPVRNGTCALVNFSWNSSKNIFSISKTVAWVVASSAVILALPVMFETERSQMEEQQLQQQRQILLGPNAAVSGAAGSMMPGFPGAPH